MTTLCITGIFETTKQTLISVQMCFFSSPVAQERWRPLLQLHSSSHPVLREARSAHTS